MSGSELRRMRGCVCVCVRARACTFFHCLCFLYPVTKFLFILDIGFWLVSFCFLLISRVLNHFPVTVIERILDVVSFLCTPHVFCFCLSLGSPFTKQTAPCCTTDFPFYTAIWSFFPLLLPAGRPQAPSRLLSAGCMGLCRPHPTVHWVPRSLAPDPKSGHFSPWSVKITVHGLCCLLSPYLPCSNWGTAPVSHSADKRCSYCLHRPVANLSCVQKSAHYTGFKMFSTLACRLTSLMNVTTLVAWWSEFLTTNHEVPGSIPGSTMCVFPWKRKTPIVTTVWVVGRN